MIITPGHTKSIMKNLFKGFYQAEGLPDSDIGTLALLEGQAAGVKFDETAEQITSFTHSFQSMDTTMSMLKSELSQPALRQTVEKLLDETSKDQTKFKEDYYGLTKKLSQNYNYIITKSQKLPGSHDVLKSKEIQDMLKERNREIHHLRSRKTALQLKYDTINAKLQELFAKIPQAQRSHIIPPAGVEVQRLRTG